MNLLLDSQVLLWAIYAPHLLTDRVRLLLLDPSTRLLVSHASLWELLGKIARGKLLLAGTSADATLARIFGLGVTLVPVTLKDILAAARLPQHHHDPFDRVIIAQAKERGLPIATSDGVIPKYDVTVVWK